MLQLLVVQFFGPERDRVCGTKLVDFPFFKLKKKTKKQKTSSQQSSAAEPTGHALILWV